MGFGDLLNKAGGNNLKASDSIKMELEATDELIQTYKAKYRAATSKAFLSLCTFYLILLFYRLIRSHASIIN